MYRSLTLANGEKWGFVVGRRMTVIRDPKYKRHFVQSNVLMGMTPDNWDDYLQNGGPGIGPQLIKDYIKEHISA